MSPDITTAQIEEISPLEKKDIVHHLNKDDLSHYQGLPVNSRKSSSCLLSSANLDKIEDESREDSASDLHENGKV